MTMTEAEIIQANRRETLIIEANYHQHMAAAKLYSHEWFMGTDEEIAENKREASEHYAKARECLFLLLSGEPLDFRW